MSTTKFTVFDVHHGAFVTSGGRNQFIVIRQTTGAARPRLGNQRAEPGSRGVKAPRPCISMPLTLRSSQRYSEKLELAIGIGV